MENNIIQKSEEDGLLSKHPKYEENPFLPKAVEELQKHVIIKRDMGRGLNKKALSLTDEQGKIYQTTFVRTIEVDECQFTKLYVDQISLFNQLSVSGHKVLYYLMSILKQNSNEIIFDRNKCMKFCNYKSHKPIYKGLAELVESGIIARSWSESIYFINPSIFYNGDRCIFANEYIKKKNPATVSKNNKFLTNSLRQIENNTYIDSRNQDLEEIQKFAENDQETPMQRRLRLQKEGPNMDDILFGEEFKDVDFSKPKD